MAVAWVLLPARVQDRDIPDEKVAVWAMQELLQMATIMLLVLKQLVLSVTQILAPPKLLSVGVPMAKYDSLSFDADSCLTENTTLFGRAVGKCDLLVFLWT